MRTIILPCYGMSVMLSGTGGGTIESSFDKEICDPPLYAALDAIESLVLAHACAGIDIETTAYVEGIETAVDAIFNHHGV